MIARFMFFYKPGVTSSSEGTSRSAPESPIIGLIENPTFSMPSAETSDKPNPSSNILLQLLKVPLMLLNLVVVELKDRKVLPFD